MPYILYVVYMREIMSNKIYNKKLEKQYQNRFGFSFTSRHRIREGFPFSSRTTIYWFINFLFIFLNVFLNFSFVFRLEYIP